ncbi:PxKF domain-containing protein [Terrabacter sp. LjRoot27]|uniref:OmpL47-type beta-barrel domain-containing protein n=1 Tax=Terrabacter sp. LjRoot27 TaxID=3342306 RepID=UPI003ECC8080
MNIQTSAVQGAQSRSRRGTTSKMRRLLAGVATGALVLGGVNLVGASASSVSSAVFSGGAGTVSVGSTLYAKQGAALTLTVTTSNDTQCVVVTGAATLPRQTSLTAKSNWTFTTTAPAGNGAQAFTVAASPNFNANNCTGQTNSTQASYTLDNTGPVVTAALSPAPNGAGWNNGDVTVRWTATDAGSGVAAAQPFQTDSAISANGIVTKTAPAQSDRLGNTGASGSVTVRLDKAKPSISGTQKDNGDGTVTVTFTCDDGNSGGGEASGIASCAADGTSPASSSKTVPGGTTVTGTATDNAGNTATASVTTTVAPIDKTAPTITHAVSPAPNAAGWNKADATVTFSCADETGGSGLASCVADGGTTASKTVSTETNGTLVSGTATDKAGNKATDSVTVKLDKTNPTITATANGTKNAAGWYKDDVTVSYTASDALSGISGIPASKVLTEGADQSASATVTDAAGNSASAGVTGVNIDKTPPVLSGSFPNGWQKDDVTVTWTCTDTLSKVASPPSNDVVKGEGSNLSSTATCTDNAGNNTTKTVFGIQIDRTAPNTGISGTSNAWVNGEVNVTLSPTDNGSGVASTTYSVDNGTQQTGTSFKLSTEGDHTVTFFSTDVAGNAEAAKTVHVLIDKTLPTIGHGFTPPSYKNGAWTNGNVDVAFTCADQGGSGVASCTGDATVTTEGTGQEVVGTAKDGAGNSATDTALVSIDKTAPKISGSVDRAANDNQWYNDDVTVTFTATDDRSGVASKTADKVLVQGADQAVTGTATDAAGNSDSATVSGISIDKTGPVLASSFSSGWHNGDVTVSWTCTDPLSGPAAQPADSIVKGEGGNLSATATCIDRAGNTTSTTVSGIQIDRNAPSTSASVSGALTNGWYNKDVSFTLAASDNLSGVAHTFYSIDGGPGQAYNAAVVIGTDGTHTVKYWSTDNAGNVEDRAGNSITLKLDKTPPTLTGKATVGPNANGWYNGDVTVVWTCSEDGSGLDANCPADSTVTGEGENLGANASVNDLAGNVTKAKVDGIKIDVTAPTTTSSVPQVPASGWYGDAVQVTLTGHDNLSQVDATYYTVDGGTAQAYSGAFPFGTEGTHEIAFWSKDNAGNVETAGAPITLSIDTTAPVTKVINPISPDSGWFVTSGIPVAFDASDVTSGVKATYYTIDGGAKQTYGEPFTADLSTGTHTISYWSGDIAGNEEAHGTTNTIQVKVDTIAPTITSTRTPVANSFGWNNTDVKVAFSCTDADSGIPADVTDGIAGCGPDQTVASEGENQSVQGDTQDVAGNTNSVTVGKISIDKTAPSLTGAPTGDSNGGEWYRSDVSVAWTGTDGLSGINPATQPANSKIAGEGRNQGTSATISDKAGNPGTGSVSGINIDRAPLGITAQLPAGKNAAGWYRGDVIIGFTCSDPALADGSAGSGQGTCPSDAVVSGDGANQSVTSAEAKDVAGNTSTKTVTGINIDGHEPQTTADNQCTTTNGYCTGATATVVLNATDVGPSGVSEIHYAVNGGSEQVAAGASKSVSVPLSGTGTASVKYYAVDVAGNVERTNEVALKYDNIAPTVTHTVNPKANASDWNNSDVTVHFDAKDTDPGSGVAAGSVTTDQVISAETSTTGLAVNGSAKDTAGNIGTDSVTVKLDKTKPSISGSVVSGTTGKNGWYVSPVKVHFACSDTLSGWATCQDDVTLSSNGANQSANGSAKDFADNVGTTSVSGISIDNENPTITSVNVTNGFYSLGATPAAACTATDDFSGLDTCKVAVTGGSNGVGTFSWTATATDKAGNSVSQTGTYKVVYKFDGFLQPINDTAHQVGTSTSVFKSGSTIPVKFVLKNAAGQAVQSINAPVWLTPVKGGAMSLPVDETLQTVSADSGSTFRYDAGQYIYNWKTPSTGGSYYQIGVRLDDGQTYFVTIGLR